MNKTTWTLSVAILAAGTLISVIILVGMFVLLSWQWSPESGGETDATPTTEAHDDGEQLKGILDEWKKTWLKDQPGDPQPHRTGGGII